jgi:ATP-binding cassette, subfamily C, bacterial
MIAPPGFVPAMVRRYPRRTALLIVLLVLSGTVESVGVFVLLPLLELATGASDGGGSAISNVVERALGRAGITPRLESLLVLISAAMVLKAAFRLAAMRQVGITVARVATDLRLDYVESLLGARWAHFVHERAGRYATAIGHEAARASAAYRQACLLFAAVVHVLIYTGIALLVSWKIALLAIAGGAVLVAVRSPLVRRARAASVDQTRLVKSIASRLTDALGAMKPIKAMGGEHYLRPLLRAEVADLESAQQRQVFATEALSASREPVLVILVCILLYATLTGAPHSFASVLVMAFVFMRLTGQIGEVQRHYQDMLLGESAYSSIRESMDIAAAFRESATGAEPPSLREEIRLVDVTFSYGGERVLREISLDIPAGGFVALIGPSGAGKTTIADLISGLHVPDSGAVLIDSMPIAQLDLAAWRRRIGYVPQGAFLFHDTLFRNVSMGDPAIAAVDVARALEQAGAGLLTQQLERGLETVLGERGARLSGGQAQRVALARALVRKPDLLILDEVTSALDPDTEAEICETLRGLRGTVTVLAISHQPAMTGGADLVYRIEGGRITPADAAAAAS